MRKTSGSRFISSSSAWFSASRYVTTAISALPHVEVEASGDVLLGVDVLVDSVDGGLRRFVGKVGGLFRDALGLGVHLLELLLAEDVVPRQQPGEDADGVVRLLLL